MFLKLLPARAILIGFIIVVGIGAFFYLLLGRETSSLVTKRVLTRQQTFVRAEASNIGFYLQTFGDSVAVFAQLSSIKERDASTTADMDTFIRQRTAGGRVAGIVLTDKSGVVLFNSNIDGTRDIGDNLADRDYFAWARDKGQEGQYFIGTPVVSRLGASEGEAIVVVASPVFQNGKFNGVVAAAVKLDVLTEQFLGLIKVSGNTDTHLVTEFGDILYSSLASELSSDIAKSLKPNEEGTLVVGTHLVAFSPLKVGNQNWLVVMTSPSQEIWGFTSPIYIRIAVLLVLVAITLFAFGIITVKEVKHQNKLSE